MTDAVLSLLGLAHKAGQVAIGEEPTGAACRAKDAKVLFLAADAADNTRRRARSFAETGNCPLLALPAEKDDLGRALGRTSCAMCAVTDIGFASALAGKLAAAEPETYGEAAAALADRAKKADKRRKEQRSHEKNKKLGRKKAASTPAPKGAGKKNGTTRTKVRSH